MTTPFLLGYVGIGGRLLSGTALTYAKIPRPDFRPELGLGPGVNIALAKLGEKLSLAIRFTPKKMC